MAAKTKKEKHDAVLRLLEDEYALVHLDPHGAGVSLPSHLTTSPSVTLKISRLFRGALTVEDDSVTADLLFGSTYFTCVVPFESVWGMTSASGSNIVWPEDAPGEVREKIVDPQAAASPTPVETPPAEKKRGHLRRVK